MITKNEAHHAEGFYESIRDLHADVLVVDSGSDDATVSAFEAHGAKVVFNEFVNFSHQWNFAVSQADRLPYEWVMKVDPDERFSCELVGSLNCLAESPKGSVVESGFSVRRELRFLGDSVDVSQKILRVWRNGRCRFQESLVNEYPVVDGVLGRLNGCLIHLDSPSIDHWLLKQLNYAKLEAYREVEGISGSNKPSLRSLDGFRAGLKQFVFRFPAIISVPLIFLLHMGTCKVWNFKRLESKIIWCFCRSFVYLMYRVEYLRLKKSDSVTK